MTKARLEKLGPEKRAIVHRMVDAAFRRKEAGETCAREGHILSRPYYEVTGETKCERCYAEYGSSR